MKIEGLENENQHDVVEMTARLTGLLEKAPSDSSATLLIRKDGNDYQGLLKIRSVHNKFVSACRSSNFKQLVESIIRDTRLQLEQWKRERPADLSFSS